MIGRLTLMALALLAATASEADAQTRPTPIGRDPRIQAVDYAADQVVELQGVPGYQLTVEFAPDEQIHTVAVGDSGAWQVTSNASGNHLFVKPLQGGVSTNMTVVSNVRSYVFDLVASSYASAETPYTVRFRYPAAAPAPGDEPAQIAVAGRYRISGSRSLRPSRISDDGQRTQVQWPEDRDLPAVFAIDARGRETLVNGMMHGDTLVIDGVFQRLVFRIDRAVARAVRTETRGNADGD
jgi:type IV secretion system protein VirB9